MSAGDMEQPPDWDWVTSRMLTPCPGCYRGRGPGGGQQQPLASAQVSTQRDVGFPHVAKPSPPPGTHKCWASGCCW